MRDHCEFVILSIKELMYASIKSDKYLSSEDL